MGKNQALTVVRVSRATLALNVIIFAILEAVHILVPAPVPVMQTQIFYVTSTLARRLAHVEVRGQRGTLTLNAFLFVILEIIRGLGAFGAECQLYLVSGFAAEHVR